MPTRFHIAALCCVALAVLAAAGCAKRLQRTLGLSNQPPVVRLTSTFTGTADAPAARLQWDAADPDGRVDHFLVTTDPAALKREARGWTKTVERQRTISVTRRAAPLEASVAEPCAPPFQLFAVRAVDDRGAVSVPAYRAFFGDNVAPTVQIIDPQPSRLLFPQVAPTFTIRWVGSDPDGPDGRVAMYKYKLYKISMIPQQWLVDPDSLLAAVAPTFAGWDSVRGNVTEVTLENLRPGEEYLFAITALDARGAYDPVFSLDKNLLRFYVNEQGRLGPRITLFNSFFFYVYPSGGNAGNLGPSFEAPADRPITVNWYADPTPGARITSYRWALDPVGPVPDSTQRKNPHDVHHWSAWSITTTSVTFGPFAPSDDQHVLFVEAQQTGGLISLGSVKLHLVSPSFANDLLIVNDTRLAVDQLYKIPGGALTDSIQKPPGEWPSAAELDTFLFAVGGVRWRMTPAGTLSPAGILKGYRYDTLGTRMGLENPTIPLDLLARYRHIIWMVDQRSSEFRNTLGEQPMPALRYMSRPNVENTLSTWVQMGGSLWALGGGFGNATNDPWNIEGNDINARVYSSFSSPSFAADLKPGRFMYDLGHWRSEFKVLPKVTIPTNGLARVDQSDPVAQIGYPLPATYWLGEPLADPRYAVLPTHLAIKNTSDAPWPFRTSYPRLIDLEFLSADNHILELARELGTPHREAQALDTLYLAFATSSAMRNDRLPGHAADVNPVMTYYHGRDCGPIVFSGFDVWHWTRADCVALTDFVLGQLWGMSRSTSAGPAAARIAGRGVSRR